MDGFLLMLCIVAPVAALGIVYLLFGPAPRKPLVTVPRASMTTMPAPHHVASAYNPEAVFALERAAAVINPTTVIPLPPAPTPPMSPAFMRGSVTAPQPRARARAARGTNGPHATAPRDAAFVESMQPHDSFVDVDATVLGDESMAS